MNGCNNYYIEQNASESAENIKTDTTGGYISESINIGAVNILPGDGLSARKRDDDFIIHNEGLMSLHIRGGSGSGIYASNIGDKNNPIYEINVSKADLVNANQLINSISFNGVEYTPIDGVLDLGSSPDGLINNIISNNRTISVSRFSVGTLSLDIVPPEVNGQTVNPNAITGTPINLIAGDNVDISVNNNDVVISAELNSDINSNVTVNGTPSDSNNNISITIGYSVQICIELTAVNISQLQAGTFDLASRFGFTFPNNDLIVYINGRYVDTFSHSINSSQQLIINNQPMFPGEVIGLIAQNRTN